MSMKNLCYKNVLICLFVLIFFTLFFNGGTQVNYKGDYLSPETLIADKNGKLVYVTLKKAKRVSIIDVETIKILREIDIPQEPMGLVLSPTMAKLYVTGGLENGKVYEIDLNTGRINFEISVGYCPSDPAISPDGKTLYVPNRFNNDVSVVDLVKHKETHRIPVKREPISSTLTSDGKILYVTHLIPDSPSDIDYVSTTVSVINTSDFRIINSISLPNGSTSLHSIVMSPDGEYLYLTHLIGNFTLPTNQIERGWINTNVFTIVDINSQKILTSILLDDLDSGAANPWGVTVSNDGAFLIFTHAGTHEVSIIDRLALHEKLDRVARGEQVTVASTKLEEVSYDFSFLVGLRNRIQLGGIGPRGVATAGGKIFVAEYFSGSLGIIDLYNPKNVETMPLGKEPELSVERRGEMLFNDATKCFQSWQSCISCHPDVKVDGLNWDLLNDGIGNPKNVKSLLLSHKTPPAMTHGIRDNAEVAVRAGFKYSLFSPASEHDAVAVDEYLKSIKPIPSPYLNKGKLNKSAQEGKVLFEKVGCNNCHSGPYYTNMKSYDVGTLKRWDSSRGKQPIDVPTLIEVWRTAPYLHDGRTMNIEEAFSSCHPDGVKGLSSDDIKALSDYVLSL